ncbi:hypothetical protein GCM10020254_82340 [Streptomyces goshikiensis]
MQVTSSPAETAAEAVQEPAVQPQEPVTATEALEVCPEPADPAVVDTAMFTAQVPELVSPAGAVAELTAPWREAARLQSLIGESAASVVATGLARRQAVFNKSLQSAVGGHGGDAHAVLGPSRSRRSLCRNDQVDPGGQLPAGTPRPAERRTGASGTRLLRAGGLPAGPKTPSWWKDSPLFWPPTRL